MSVRIQLFWYYEVWTFMLLFVLWIIVGISGFSVLTAILSMSAAVCGMISMTISFLPCKKVKNPLDRTS